MGRLYGSSLINSCAMEGVLLWNEDGNDMSYYIE